MDDQVTMSRATNTLVKLYSKSNFCSLIKTYIYKKINCFCPTETNSLRQNYVAKYNNKPNPTCTYKYLSNKTYLNLMGQST